MLLQQQCPHEAHTPLLFGNQVAWVLIRTQEERGGVKANRFVQLKDIDIPLWLRLSNVNEPLVC